MGHAPYPLTHAARIAPTRSEVVGHGRVRVVAQVTVWSGADRGTDLSRPVQSSTRGSLVNPIRLVTGALTLPAHAAAAVIGTSVGVATTGVRTTARVLGRVIEQVSGAKPAPDARWAADRRSSTGAAPVPGTRTATGQAPTTEPPAAPQPPTATTAPATAARVTPAPAAPAPVKTAAAGTAGAKKAPATKTAAKRTPAKKAAARKSPAKKASSKQAAVLAPALGLSEAEVEAQVQAGVDDDVTTPSGIPAAGRGVNPDTTETDLHQPGTEPLMDPATAKAIASESEVLRRGADTDKG